MVRNKDHTHREEPTFSRKKERNEDLRGEKREYKKSKSKSPKSKKVKKFAWPALRLITILSVWTLLLGGAFVGYIAYDLPSLESLKPGARKPSLTFKSVDGDVLSTYGEYQEKTYALSEISPTLIKAVIAIEDRRFYYHVGVDFYGLIRAAWQNMRAGTIVQGGSTLTQQLAKNLFLTPERSLKRKVQEVLLAFWLEQRFTKDQILTIYLNRVYFGSGTYGVGAAASKYFSKTPGNLNLFEAALIAGLLKAPSSYAPTQHPERARARCETVLDAMVEMGAITSWEKTEALVERLAPPSQAQKIEGVRYFTDWVKSEIGRLLPNLAAQDLVVTTTLDPTLQNKADKAIEQALASKEYDGLEVSLVSMSVDGAVRAMIGGRSYEQSQFNRATQSLRQPGSLFKLFVYLAALEKGSTPDDITSDEPIRIGTWSPKNYGWKSIGRVTVRQAFAHSINTSTVRMGQKVGVPAIQEIAKKLGIRSPISSNLSITLGTSEVRLIEMTNAFAIIANGGTRTEPFGVLRIEDKAGNVLYERVRPEPVVVLTPEIVSTMDGMLLDVVTYGTGRAAQVAGLKIAGKTGTTQEKRDAWFIGYTPHLVTGVGVGIDEEGSETTKRSTGGQIPAQLFHQYMSALNSSI